MYINQLDFPYNIGNPFENFEETILKISENSTDLLQNYFLELYTVVIFLLSSATICIILTCCLSIHTSEFKNLSNYKNKQILKYSIELDKVRKENSKLSNKNRELLLELSMKKHEIKNMKKK